MNQEQSSNYKLAYSAECGRLAIMEKDTGRVVESFGASIPDSLLTQRMYEIREDELVRQKLVAGTSLEGTTGNEGLIVAGNQGMIDAMTQDNPYENTTVEKGDIII